MLLNAVKYTISFRHGKATYGNLWQPVATCGDGHLQPDCCQHHILRHLPEGLDRAQTVRAAHKMPCAKVRHKVIYGIYGIW
jgi:hypothetical protein